jgi:hypothetical protein
MMGLFHECGPLTLDYMKRANVSERVGGAERGSWGPASGAVWEPAGAESLGNEGSKRG